MSFSTDAAKIKNLSDFVKFYESDECDLQTSMSSILQHVSEENRKAIKDEQQKLDVSPYVEALKNFLLIEVPESFIRKQVCDDIYFAVELVGGGVKDPHVLHWLMASVMRDLGYIGVEASRSYPNEFSPYAYKMNFWIGFVDYAKDFGVKAVK